MRTAFKKGGKAVVRDIELRKIRDEEIRIKVEACGICGTDLHETSGEEKESPFGHEVAGEVIEIGKSVTGLKLGQKVALDSSTPCGRCDNCRNTMQELCTNIQSFFINGTFGFAEEMIFPAISAVVYDAMTPELACVSEPLGVAIDMHRLADVRIGSHVLVSGLGPIGLMALRLAKLAGAEKIYACDISAAKARFEIAKKFGADEIIEVDKTPLDKFKFAKAPDRIMISSPPQTIPPALKIAAKGAIISFIGIKYGDGATISFDANDFHFKKLQLRASFASPALFTPMALNLLKSGAVDGESLISHRFKLDKIQEALDTAKDMTKKSLKVVVKP